MLQNPLAAASLVIAFSAQIAGATTLNFDNYVDATNLNGVNLGGVTITNPSGMVQVYSNRMGVGSHSGLNAIASLYGSFSASSNPMVFVFDTAVSFVELFAGDAGGPSGDFDQWTMNVYDAVTGGNLLASLTSPVFQGSPYAGLSYSGTGVRRIEAIWTAPGCCGIGFDDLTFTAGTGGGGGTPAPVPLPAGGLLLSGALAAIGLARRRKRA